MSKQQQEPDPMALLPARQEPAQLAVVPASPLAMIAQAVKDGTTPETLSKLMDLAERWEKNKAAGEFAEAMAKFQQQCPPIHKGRAAKQSGSFAGYNYASFDNIMAAIRPVLAECGLSVSFDTEHVNGDKPGQLNIVVILKKGIHEHRTRFTCPVPDMKVNDTQRYGAAMSYAKRYALCAALNIVTTDEDNDGAGLDVKIGEGQLVTLKDMIDGYGVDTAKFLAYLNITTLADLPASRFDEAYQALKRKEKKA